jgi:hypothetical protein
MAARLNADQVPVPKDITPKILDGKGKALGDMASTWDALSSKGATGDALSSKGAIGDELSSKGATGDALSSKGATEDAGKDITADGAALGTKGDTLDNALGNETKYYVHYLRNNGPGCRWKRINMRYGPHHFYGDAKSHPKQLKAGNLKLNLWETAGRADELEDTTIHEGMRIEGGGIVAAVYWINQAPDAREDLLGPARPLRLLIVDEENKPLRALEFEEAKPMAGAVSVPLRATWESVFSNKGREAATFLEEHHLGEEKQEDDGDVVELELVSDLTRKSSRTRKATSTPKDKMKKGRSERKTLSANNRRRQRRRWAAPTSTPTFATSVENPEVYCCVVMDMAARMCLICIARTSQWRRRGTGTVTSVCQSRRPRESRYTRPRGKRTRRARRATSGQRFRYSRRSRPRSASACSNSNTSSSSTNTNSSTSSSCRSGRRSSRTSSSCRSGRRSSRTSGSGPRFRLTSTTTPCRKVMLRMWNWRGLMLMQR